MAPKPALDRKVLLLFLGMGATIAYLAVQCTQYNLQLQRNLQQIEDFEHRVRHLERRVSHSFKESHSQSLGEAKTEKTVQDLVIKVNSFLSWNQTRRLVKS